MDSVTWSEVCSSKSVIMGLMRYAFRREFSASKLAAVGFTNIELVDSFDGFNGDVDAALDKLGVKFNPGLRKGHKGCSYTQMAAWKQMIDDGVPYRVFFEDDAIPHLDMKTLGDKFWNQTPKDFDILYMGNMMGNIDLKQDIVKVPTYCLHAYMLTRKGALRMFELAKEANGRGEPLNMLDIQLVQWQVAKKIEWYCWNGTQTQRSYPTFDESLPWQHFPVVITPYKDTGLFWQNMRVGTTLEHPTLQIAMPQYSI
jgi:hypothetical protein